VQANIPLMCKYHISQKQKSSEYACNKEPITASSE